MMIICNKHSKEVVHNILDDCPACKSEGNPKYKCSQFMGHIFKAGSRNGSKCLCGMTKKVKVKSKKAEWFYAKSI